MVYLQFLTEDSSGLAKACSLVDLMKQDSLTLPKKPSAGGGEEANDFPSLLVVLLNYNCI